ncbi:MAG: hypothetical protein O7G88_05600 [bacterium]|nr:hypothetical protein [bacterium]
MRQQASRGRNEIVAHLVPGFGAATVERIAINAINAINAGCDSESLPVLIVAGGPCDHG